MKKSTIIPMILALLIGVGTAVFVAQRESGKDTQQTGEQRQTAEEAPSTDADEAETTEVIADHTVAYTDDGYNPDDITVAAGETVEFRNESSGELWTASDQHPAHTDLPDFDAGSGIGTGQSYSFTFSESGTWGYHNHLQPSHTGVVRVE